jgi:L-fuconolactonase
MRVIDAQVHIWLPESAEREWPAGGTAHAHAPSFAPSALLEQMKGAGVDAAVLVPPSWEGDRNDYCSNASADHPDRFVYLARLDLSSPLVVADYARVRSTPGFAGIRLTFRKPESRALLESGAVDWLWAALADDGVPVCVYAPGLLGTFLEIARRREDLRLGIDHLGLPLDSTEDDLKVTIDQLIDFAPLGNVALKATCLPSHVRDAYPYQSVHEPVERLVDTFGPQRVFWGSDLSRLRGTYDEVRRLFMEEMLFLSGETLEFVMGRGVQEWLGVDL